MKNNAPSAEAQRKKIPALPAEKARELNRRIGSIGSAARSSHQMKPTVSSAPAVSAETTSVLPHPAGLPRTNPQTSANAAQVLSTRPGRSTAETGPWLSGMRARQHDRDDAGREVEPEDPRPGDALHDGAADQRAQPDGQPGHTDEHSQRPGRSGSGNAAASSASACGITRAAPAPCTARAAISG